MRLIRHRVHTRRVNPPVVEVEERTNCDAEIELLVRPAGRARRLQVIGADARGFPVDLVQQLEQRLVAVVERGRPDVTKD